MSDLEENLEHTASSFDQARFRQVMGHFCTGVTIVTAIDDGEPVGMTAQSFTSLSLEPPLVLFCPGVDSSTWPRIKRAGAFCFNILGETQEALCRTFAMKGADKFAHCTWTPSDVTGAPVLNDVIAWVDCTLDADHDGGDHRIVVGRVVDLAIEDEGPPLLFFRGGFGKFEV